MALKNTWRLEVGRRTLPNLTTEKIVASSACPTRALAPIIDDSTELSSIWLESHSEARIPTICMTTQHTSRPIIARKSVPLALNTGTIPPPSKADLVSIATATLSLYTGQVRSVSQPFILASLRVHLQLWLASSQYTVQVGP